MMKPSADEMHDPQYPHLLKETAKAFRLSDGERISYLARDRWIPYDTANEMIAAVSSWREGPRKKRPQCIMLAGRSDNGKSRILDRIAELHPPDAERNGHNIHAPVLRLQTPPSANGVSCYEGICTMLNQPVRKPPTEASWRSAAVEALRAVDAQVLMWDEINALLSGSMPRRKEFLFALKFLSNELLLNVVVAGTPESLQLLRVSDQIQSRFKVKPLMPWKLSKRFQILLANFEELLPLKKPSDLASKAVATQIAELDLNTFGAIAAFLDEAAEKAIRSGAEMITPDIIQSCKPVSGRDLRRLEARL